MLSELWPNNKILNQTKHKTSNYRNKQRFLASIDLDVLSSDYLIAFAETLVARVIMNSFKIWVEIDVDPPPCII